MPNVKSGRVSTTTKAGGGMVYGLGIIGSLVFYWQQAEGFGAFVTGLLKALAWPAFLVYEAFQAIG